MTDSYTAELRDIIDRAFTDDLGGRATVQMLHAKVFDLIPEHLAAYLIGQGLRKRVTAYFNEKDGEGLPKRPAANDQGEHAQLEFFSVEEFAYVHRCYLDRASANAAQAEKVRALCLTSHGVDLDDQRGAA